MGEGNGAFAVDGANQICTIRAGLGRVSLDYQGTKFAMSAEWSSSCSRRDFPIRHAVNGTARFVSGHAFRRAVKFSPKSRLYPLRSFAKLPQRLFICFDSSAQGVPASLPPGDRSRWPAARLLRIGQ
jgi:hypothetical protein